MWFINLLKTLVDLLAWFTARQRRRRYDQLLKEVHDVEQSLAKALARRDARRVAQCHERLRLLRQSLGLPAE
jgi:hypothetical protein